MKTFLKIVNCTVLGGLMLTGKNIARADLEVSASVRVSAVAEFNAPLAPHGAWITVGSYGRCWRPSGIAVGWRPYCYGHWVWTDCGWYWESDEPWGWACYHYGSWAYDSEVGWVWVPGIEWAPAWVTWRFGGGYCGWAPVGPRGFVVAPALFVFVEERRFIEPVRPTTVVVNNTTIINKTKVVTGSTREERRFEGGTAQKVVVNNGPGVDFVQKATGRKMSAAPIREVAQRTKAPSNMERKTESRPHDPRVAEPSTNDGKPSPSDKGKSPDTADRPATPRPPERGVEPAPDSPSKVIPPGQPKGGRPGKDVEPGRGRGKPSKQPDADREERGSRPSKP